jgi:hypothetical protein
MGDDTVSGGSSFSLGLWKLGPIPLSFEPDISFSFPLSLLEQFLTVLFRARLP